MPLRGFCQGSRHRPWPGPALYVGFALFGFLFSGGSDLRGRTACAGAAPAAAAADNDLARPRTGRGPTDTAVARHTAVNLPRHAEPAISLENRRERAGWNTAHLESLVRQAARTPVHPTAPRRTPAPVDRASAGAQGRGGRPGRSRRRRSPAVRRAPRPTAAGERRRPRAAGSARPNEPRDRTVALPPPIPPPEARPCRPGVVPAGRRGPVRPRRAGRPRGALPHAGRGAALERGGRAAPAAPAVSLGVAPRLALAGPGIGDAKLAFGRPAPPAAEADPPGRDERPAAAGPPATGATRLPCVDRSRPNPPRWSSRPRRGRRPGSPS